MESEEPKPTESIADKIADQICNEIYQYYNFEFDSEVEENDTNLEAIFPHLMLEGRAFTATIDRAYYSHYNPNMAEPTWLNHEAQWRPTTANFAEFKAATQAFLEHPDTILVPKGTAVIDLDLD